MRVFVGYKSEDRERVRRLADGLRQLGHDVFWDQQIEGGSAWRQSIGDNLTSADVAVFCWSIHTQDPHRATWVLDEADEARRLGKPVFSVLFDPIELPLGHRQTQAANLSAWNGQIGDPTFLAFAHALSMRQPTQAALAVPRAGLSVPPALTRAAVMLAFAGLALFGWIKRDDIRDVMGLYAPHSIEQLHPAVAAAAQNARDVHTAATQAAAEAAEAAERGRVAARAARAGEPGHAYLYPMRDGAMDMIGPHYYGTDLPEGQTNGVGLVFYRRSGNPIGYGNVVFNSVALAGMTGFVLVLGEKDEGELVGRFSLFQKLTLGIDRSVDGQTRFIRDNGGVQRDGRTHFLQDVYIEFDDGRRYEGGWDDTYGVSRGYDGYGVMWDANGRVTSAGLWRAGQLVEPLERGDRVQSEGSSGAGDAQ